MKLNKYIKLMSLGLLAVALGSCENSDIEFPDSGNYNVYFPYQYPVRTIALGDEEYDTSMDQAHKCLIMATFGGSYNGSNGVVQVEVDNNLVNDLTFEDGTPVKFMPENYYQLSTKTLAFNGTFNGITEVQLTDAFFADANAVSKTYVIPLVMRSQTGFKSIITGVPNVEGETPVRTNSSAWKVLPQDYILYCVKYQNKYTGYWLADGVDEITGVLGTESVSHKSTTVEKRIVKQLTTKDLNTCYMTVEYGFKYINDKGEEKTDTRTAQLVLTFDTSGVISVMSNTEGVTASGSGKWVDNGAKQAWNNKDRDMIDLTYEVKFDDNHYAKSTDNLIWERSGIDTEEFAPIYTK